MSHRPSRRSYGLVVLAALCIPLSACAASSDSSAQGALIVRDGSLRALDTDCSGSGPYLFIHSGAQLTIRDSSGTKAETVKLKLGEAIAADTKDYGTARRVPSYCSFAIPTATLTSGETYVFAIDGTELGELVYIEGPDGPEPIAYPALGNPTTPQEDPQP